MKDDDTDEVLLEELRRIHDAVGVPPRTVDMGKHGRFNPALYADRFGSWEEALDAAGIEGEPQRPPEDVAVEDPTPKEDETLEENGTKEEIKEEPDENKGIGKDLDEYLKELQRCDERIEGTPNPQDLRERGVSVNAVLEKHGTWGKALEAASIETEYVETKLNKKLQNSKEKNMLKKLRRYRSLNHKVPSANDIRETDWIRSPKEYREVFGTVENAVEEAFREETDGTEANVDKLLADIKRYYLRVGTVPESEDVCDADWMPPVEKYRDAFGGVEEAVEATGITGDGV